MSPDFAPYRDIIHSLAPMVNQSTFQNAFDKRTKDVANKHKFLLKMEVKRLAKPCIRSIDLRRKIKDTCELYTYGGIQHYLHGSAIQAFEKLTKHYGGYTFGVYEGVLEFAEKEKKRQALVKTPSKVRYEAEIDTSESTFLTPCQELLNFPSRKEERLNYVVAIEVFFNDNTSAHASTIDLSVSGLKIRFKDPKSLHKLRGINTLHIVFRGLNKSSRIHRERIEYQILGLSGIGAKSCIHLYRTQINKHPSFNTFVSNLVNQYKRRYKVNLDNVEMALSSKIYEQSFANANTSLPVFLGENKQGHLGPLYMSLNGCAKRITDYWLNENYQQMLGYLFSPLRVRYLLSKATGESMTVYCFHHIDKEKIYFYSAYLHELLEQPKLAETFLAYGSRRVSWRVFNLCVQHVNPNDAYLPTSLPDDVSKAAARANKPLSPRLKGRIGKIQAIVSIADVTNTDNQAVYQRRQLNKLDIRLLKYFGHPRNKPPMTIDPYRHKEQDLRRQARYVFRTPIIVSANQMRIHGFTEDISISGLRLQLDQPFSKRVNSKVSVTFPKLNEIAAGYDLTSIQYRVKAVKADKHILHLQADEDESNCKPFFTELIQANIEKLLSLQHDEKLPGMSLALRNLHARSSSQVCIYIEKKPQGFIPAMTTANPVPSTALALMRDNGGNPGVANYGTLNTAWLFLDDDDSQGYIRKCIENLSNDSGPTSAELFVCYDPSAINAAERVIARWDYQLSTHRAKLNFIHRAQKLGEFCALSITINKAPRPDTEILEHELKYLSQQAIHKAANFEERMWDIAAVLFMTDITQETRFRYRIKVTN
ncbi:MAG: PilZ domain-containing protein [Pseudomonadota bacterium]